MDKREKRIMQILEMIDAQRKAPFLDCDAYQTIAKGIEAIIVDMKKKGFMTNQDVHTFQEEVLALAETGSRIDIEPLGKLFRFWLTRLLSIPVRQAIGVGPAREKRLNALGIQSIYDLLTHYPMRYEDRSQIRPIRFLENQELATVMGVVENVSERRVKNRMHLLKVAVHDGNDRVYGVWFNQPFIRQQIEIGQNIILSGKVEKKFGEVQIQSPFFETLDSHDSLHVGRIVPIYKSTDQLTQKMMRRMIKDNLDRWAESWVFRIPDYLMEKYRLMNPVQAIKHVHFPESEDDLRQAKRTLVYEELLMLQLQVQMKKRQYVSAKAGISHTGSRRWVDAFISAQPFILTSCQERAINEILADMENHEPMNRLLQGDVGSGKTLVAAAALIKTVECGYQGALLAPTEILAEQHFLKLSPFFTDLKIQCELLTGSLKAADKSRIYEAVRLGQVNVLIGTHALLQEPLEFHSLGLAVTDEQHRFGVAQRSRLQNKGKSPDVLVMSATPIPRTLTLTVFGDLDVSTIKALPPGRKPIQTYWVPVSLRQRIYAFIREQIQHGRQAYIVCPLVEESEKLQTEAAVTMAKQLRAGEFSDFQVGLLHGRLKSEEKDQVMKRFRSGEIQVLVATTVIEVGVDVPNANVMVIEGADRFGLAQLHQLRGRVGRGEHTSYCILVAEAKSEEIRARLNALCQSTDGFAIAEEDLRLRGPGEYLGTRQHGITNLKIADLIQDSAVMEAARGDAIEMLGKEPQYGTGQDDDLNEELAFRFGGLGPSATLS